MKTERQHKIDLKLQDSTLLRMGRASVDQFTRRKCCFLARYTSTSTMVGAARRNGTEGYHDCVGAGVAFLSRFGIDYRP